MEKKVIIVFALIALLILLVFGSFLFKNYFRENICGNNKCDVGETEKTCPTDCKKIINATQPVTPVKPVSPTQQEKELVEKTGLSLDEIKKLSSNQADFFNDADKDGLVNGLEKEIGTNSKEVTSNGETDSDGDNVTDLQEYISGTNSKDSNSKP